VLDLPVGQDAVLDRPMYLKIGDAQPTRDSVLKLIKRIGYGDANFDLLRKRIVLRA
jgi:hypothetical protein